MATTVREPSATQFIASSIYPATPEAAAKHFNLGKRLQDVQAPAPVIDLAVACRNCELMLKTTADLGIKFRAHVKTHKTTQLAQFQVGKDSTDIRLVVSTVAEAESLLPWLLECKANGKRVNVLYGLPVAPSAVPRLARLAQCLGEGSIGLFVDHPDHIRLLDKSQWPHGKVPVHVKADVGYHRAGVIPDTSQFKDLALAMKSARAVQLAGFYTHMGGSYDVSSPQEALKYLAMELEGLEACAKAFLEDAHDGQSSSPLLLSFGASPTATATQNFADDTEESKHCKNVLDRLKKNFEVELHAGVYPLMDMQQLATRARPKHVASSASETLLSFADLGLRILVEVASVYNDRDQPEALIAAGSIVFGKDQCKSYPGWGVVSSWPLNNGQIYDPDEDRTGWIVERLSQEHGILQWQGSQENYRSLSLGQKLLIWPNHACMSGPNFACYLIVDSGRADPNEVIDVWTRSRGW